MHSIVEHRAGAMAERRSPRAAARPDVENALRARGRTSSWTRIVNGEEMRRAIREIVAGPRGEQMRSASRRRASRLSSPALSGASAALDDRVGARTTRRARRRHRDTRRSARRRRAPDRRGLHRVLAFSPDRAAGGDAAATRRSGRCSALAAMHAPVATSCVLERRRSHAVNEPAPPARRDRRRIARLAPRPSFSAIATWIAISRSSRATCRSPDRRDGASRLRRRHRGRLLRARRVEAGRVLDRRALGLADVRAASRGPRRLAAAMRARLLVAA